MCYNYEYDKAELSKTQDAARVTELTRAVAAAEEHIRVRDHQRKTLHDQRAALQMGTAVCQQDFTSIDLKPLVQVCRGGCCIHYGSLR
jgi:hypothetical protein